MTTVEQNNSALNDFDDNNATVGRRVFLESPSLGNKEEEDMYRYVSSRLSEHPGLLIDSRPVPTTTNGQNLMDSLDMELNMLDGNHPRSQVPYRATNQQVPNHISRTTGPVPNYSQSSISDPRKDPLLGPLLAELDAMSTNNTNSLPQNPSSTYQRDFVPYNRPVGLPQTNQNFANRTINDALLEAELFQPLEPIDQVPPPPIHPALNPTNSTSRPINMNSNDVYVPSSYSYEPVSFLSQFGPEDQLFQRSLLPNVTHTPRLPPVVPPTNPSYQRAPGPLQFNEPPSHQRYLNDRADPFFTDNNNLNETSLPPPSFNPQYEDESKRQVWNDLQRTNFQKRDSANRSRGTSNNQQQKPNVSHQYRPPIGTRVNTFDETNDGLRSKENSYQRSPTKRYEETFHQRKPSDNFSQNEQFDFQNLPPQNNHVRDNNSSPRTVAVPMNSQISRVGDKITLNIDLKLVDVPPNNGKESTNQTPQWSSVDPLDRHIRKLERNIDQALPAPNPPVRYPAVPSTNSHSSPNRSSKGPVRPGYSPPMYTGSNYEKPVDDDSYLSKLHYAKKSPQFKPYTSRDYEQFKKNYGFGTGHLGFEFDNRTYKEKTEKLAKTREYAQQVEARNKKKFSNATNRTWSDTRLPNKRQTQRPPELNHAGRIVQRHSVSPRRPGLASGLSAHSTPPELLQTNRASSWLRPTAVLQLPPMHNGRYQTRTEPTQIISQKNQSHPFEKRPDSFMKSHSEPIIPSTKSNSNRPSPQRLSSGKNLPPIPRRPIKFTDGRIQLNKQTPPAKSMFDEPNEKDNGESFFVD